MLAYRCDEMPLLVALLGVGIGEVGGRLGVKVKECRSPVPSCTQPREVCQIT